MAGEDPVKISIEAREELSRVVQQIDSSLDRLKSSLGTLNATLASTDGVSERTEDSLDEVGDEASQASVKISTLAAAVHGFNMVPIKDKELDLDLDEKGLKRLREGELTLKEAMDSIVDKDKEFRKRQFFKMPGAPDFKKKRKSLNELFKRYRPNVELDIDTSNISDDARSAKEAAENAAGDINVGANVPDGEVGDISEDINEAIKAAETNAIQLDAEVKETALADVESDVNQIITEVEAVTRSITLGIDITDAALAKVPAETQGLVRITEAATDSIKLDVKIDASDEALELASLVAAMNAQEVAALKNATANKIAASQIDNVGDQASESAGELTVLQSVMSLASLNTTALSLNVGAFNIALSNLATQIPILVGLLGTLLTAIMGLVGALSLAVAGVSAFIGAGLVAELTRIDEKFSAIEGRAEAMQVMMQALADAFEDAIAPLTEMGESTDIFYSSVNRLLRAVNMMSASIAGAFSYSNEQMENFIATGRNLGIISDSMSDSEAADSIMSLGEFMSHVSDMFSENAGDIIASFEVMAAYLLPVIDDLITYFVTGFDDMILFTTKFTVALSKLGPAFGELIQFAVELIELASTVAQGLLPVLVGLLGIGSEVASMFNSLNPQIVRNVAGIVLLAAVTSKLYSAMVSLRKAIGFVVAGTKLQAYWQHLLNLRTALLAGNITKLEAVKLAIAGVNVTVANTIRSLSLARIAENSLILKTIGRTWSLIAAKVRDAAATAMQSQRLYLLISAMHLFIPQLIYAHGLIFKMAAAKLYDAAVTAKAAVAQKAYAAATYIAGSAVGGFMTKLWGAVAAMGVYIINGIGTIATTLGIAGAYATLSAATGGLLTAVGALAAALVLIVGAGALAVGGLANMDSVTSGLSETLSVLKSMAMDVVNVFLGSFISVWNSLMTAVEGGMLVWDALAGGLSQIGEALGFASDEGSMLGGIWDMLVGALDLLLMPIDLLFKLIGGLAFVIGSVLATAIDVIVGAITIYINMWSAVIGVVTDVIDKMLEFAGITGGIGSIVDTIKGAIDALIDTLMSLPQIAGSVFGIFAVIVEGIVNTVIGGINSIIESLPQKVRDKLGIGTLEDVELDSIQGDRNITREDVISEDTGDAKNEVEPDPPAELNYEEYVENNIDQEINADPEDKESLDRVVKDAMEEANAFSRRNQGHGG